MELSPSSEAVNYATTQQIPSILWKQKVHYRLHKGPPIILILSQINPVHTITSSLRYILIICTWSLTLREEHRLRVFEKRVLMRIF
jgi:hypothetical protein